jgi:hypothetical protein
MTWEDLIDHVMNGRECIVKELDDQKDEYKRVSDYFKLT